MSASDVLASPPARGPLSIDAALSAIGVGSFQGRLLGIFGLVWAADAMQVLSIGFAAPSLAKEFGLTIPQAIQVGTVFFFGMLIGAWGFGRLADRIGRRNVLIVSVLCDAVFGLLSAFAPNMTILLILRFFTGAAVGGTLPVDYAMMAEFLPTANRGRWLVGLEAFWAVGTLALALVSWLAVEMGVAAPWRWIFAACALPALIGIFLRLWVPESPHYLARTGDPGGALDVLNRVARTNGRPPLAGPLVTEQQARAPLSALFDGGLLRPSLLILSVWLLVSLAYYGVFVWLPSQLAAQGHGFVRGPGFLVLLALAQLPGYALAAWGVESWGRRPTLIGFLLLSALGCFLYVVAGSPGMIITSALLMSFAMLGAWGALYAFTPEIYPTRLRGTGMGTAGAMARLGGLLAPSAVGLVVAMSFPVAIASFAFLLVVAAIATYAINVETRGAALS
jgi:MFS transporter, putative metabolite:H+ symporter